MWVAWSPEDVGRWLCKAVNLPQYSDTFQEHAVDGPTLMELTEALLREALNVENVLHRKKIVAHIKLLRVASRPTTEEFQCQNGQDDDGVGSASTACTEPGVPAPEVFSSHVVEQATGTHSTVNGNGRDAMLGIPTSDSRLPQTQPLLPVPQHRQCFQSLRHARSAGTLPSMCIAEPRSGLNRTLQHQVRGPLAIYHGMSATARRAAERSNIAFDWAYFELTGEASPDAALSSPETRRRQQASPRLDGIVDCRRLSNTGSETPRTPLSRASPSSRTPVKRSHSATPVGTASTVPCCGPLTSGLLSPEAVLSTSRQRRTFGGDGLVSSETRSPRAIIGTATRDDEPWIGKLAWQPRPREATPGAGAYSPETHSSFLAKPARGSIIGQARRFGASGDSSNYPAWLRD